MPCTTASRRHLPPPAPATFSRTTPELSASRRTRPPPPPVLNFKFLTIGRTRSGLPPSNNAFTFSEKGLPGGNVRTMKARSVIALTPQQPVWCHRCCIRIAPYDIKTVHHGKNYHRECYNKINHEKAQA